MKIIYKENPTVTIGIPSYEREQLLLSKIKNLKAQTYKQKVFIISCNSKISNKTSKKIKKLLKKHKYILFQQKKNIGAWSNFLFVLQKATSPLFMWASDDDYHHPKFIENLVPCHLKNGACVLAMSGFENVNARGKKYRKVKQIWEYFDEFKKVRPMHVIGDPEVFGKANYIYGIWDTGFLKTICAKLDDHICVDQAIVMAGLLQNQVAYTKKILFKKTNSNEKRTQKINFHKPEKGYYFRLRDDRIYQKNILKVLLFIKNPFFFFYFVRRLLSEKFI